MMRSGETYLTENAPTWAAAAGEYGLLPRASETFS